MPKLHHAISPRRTWRHALAAAAVAVLTGAVASLARGQEVPPPDLLPFVDEGSEVVTWKRADLDGDGRADYLLIQQGKDLATGDMDSVASRRVLKIVLASRRGGHRVAVVNDRLVRCQSCGGVWPDPLDEVFAQRRGFTVSHYGGSRWRWSDSWRFDYEARSRRWLLTTVTEGYDTADEGHQVLTYRRGRHFGTIGLEAVDPALLRTRYLRKGRLPRPVRDDSRS